MPGKYFEIIVSGRQLASFVAVVAALVVAGFGLGVVVGLQQPDSALPEPVVLADSPAYSPSLPAPVFEPYRSPAPAATEAPAPVGATPPPPTGPTPVEAPPTEAPLSSAPAESPAPAEPEPTAPAPAAAGRWVQVAALSKREQADGVRTRVIATGFTAAQVVVQPASGGKFRVRLGPFPDGESAKRVAARLQEGGFPGAFVVRE